LTKKKSYDKIIGSLSYNDENSNMQTVCITEVCLAVGENTRTLRLTSELVDLRVGIAMADSTNKVRRATALKLRTHKFIWRYIEAVITRLS